VLLRSQSICKASLSGAIVPKRRGRAVVAGIASGAALADAADAANRRLTVHSPPPRSSTGARPLTPSSSSPRRVSPRRLDRLGLGSPSSRAKRSLASPSGRSPRSRMPSADEYAVWRAAALAHMRRKQEQQQSGEEDKEQTNEGIAAKAPATVETAA